MAERGGGGGASDGPGRAAPGEAREGRGPGRMAARWSRGEVGTVLTTAAVAALWLGADRLFERDLRLRREALLARTAAEAAALSPAQARFLLAAERAVVELARAAPDADWVSCYGAPRQIPRSGAVPNSGTPLSVVLRQVAEPQSPSLQQ
jgi:hypothetical protein